MSARAWHLLTGEFPPASGGVSDYTRALADALTSAGDEVHVWAPGRELDLPRNVFGHPLRSGFTLQGLLDLERGLAAFARPTILLQYVPNAFGWRGMNVPLVAWLSRLRASLWLMLHEVALFPDATDRVRLRVVGRVTQRMARRLVSRADVLLASTSAWRPYLARIGHPEARPTTLPIPSNLPLETDPNEVARVRESLGRDPVVSHFGTYGRLVAEPLADTLLAYDAAGGRGCLQLLGRGGAAFAERLSAHASWSGRLRIEAPGALDVGVLATRIAASDVIVQPYPDGVTTRRTTVMAGLGLGVPVVTNRGPLTEGIWEESDAVELASPAPFDLAAATLRLVGDPSAARRRGEQGRVVYEREFSMDRTVERLHALREGR